MRCVLLASLTSWILYRIQKVISCYFRNAGTLCDF